jgi:hypothetical protein
MLGQRLARALLRFGTARQGRVHVSTRLFGHSERAVAQTGRHVFAGPAVGGQLEIVDGGAAVHRDQGDGGVVLNLGSAVVMPEVFLKALTVSRNLQGGKPKNFTACDCDMQRHYRPRVNVVERPTLAGGRGIQLTGHHEILFPLITWAVLAQLARK